MLAASGDFTIRLALIVAFGAVFAMAFVPLLLDVWFAHRTLGRAVEKMADIEKQKLPSPSGMKGLNRVTMALAVVVVIGFAAMYLVVAKPFEDSKNSTIFASIVSALTATLAAVTAFYFGSRMASEARTSKQPDSSSTAGGNES